MFVPPTIHLNGSSGQELLNQTREARDAVKRAIIALAGATPNARDYYPQGPDAYRRACQAHQGHMAELGSVGRALEAQLAAIVDQLDARKRQREGR